MGAAATRSQKRIGERRSESIGGGTIDMAVQIRRGKGGDAVQDEAHDGQDEAHDGRGDERVERSRQTGAARERAH